MKIQTQVNIEWNLIKEIVSNSNTVEEALNNCINKDIIFVSHEIKNRFNLSTEEYHKYLQTFRFL